MTSDSDIGEQGGSFEIRPEDIFDSAPDSSNAPRANASPAPLPDMRPGDIVSPADRENVGEVLQVDGRRALVYFVNKKEGGSSEKWFPTAALVFLRRPSKQRELRILGFDDLMALRPPESLVDGILRARELAVAYGASGCGKSFLVLSLLLSVATGNPWFGHTVQKGPVLYVAGEGLFGLPARIRAWIGQFPADTREALGAELRKNLRVLGTGLSFFAPEEFERFLALVQELPDAPAAIAVDTLARCMAGGDENSAKDMGLFVQACDRLREETGSAVVVVHHSGKAEKGERGSSALRGAADTMIELADEGGGRVRMSCSKQKEDAAFQDLVLERNTVTVEFLGEGKVVQSCFLSPLGGETESGQGHADLGDASLQICRTLMDAFFEDGATGPQLMDASEQKKSSFYEKLKAAVEKGYIERFKDKGHWRYRATNKLTGPRVQRVQDIPLESVDTESAKSTGPRVLDAETGPSDEIGTISASAALIDRAGKS